LTLNNVPSASQEGDDLLTAPLPVAKIIRTKSVNVMKIPRIRRSSVEPYQSTSTISVKIQPTKKPHRNLSDLGSTKQNQRRASNVSVSKITRSSSTGPINRTNQRSASNVSVSKIKRSSSTGPINRTNQLTATASSNIDLSRVTVIKMK
jgi:hypothetical protein